MHLKCHGVFLELKNDMIKREKIINLSEKLLFVKA